MTQQLSWQPPPVTKCGECKYVYVYSDMIGVNQYSTCTKADNSHELYQQNKDGITESCPMWQQQNKEVK